MTPPVAPEPLLTDEARIIPLFDDSGRGGNINDAYRLQRAIVRVRKLLDDPVALQYRIEALLNGTARSLLALAIVGLTAIRLVGGPSSVPNFYLHGNHCRRDAVAVTSPCQEIAF